MISCILIDDEQHCIEWLANIIGQTKLLKIEGTFTDPREALSWLAANKVDVVFTDIQMPDISGIDILKTYHGKVEFVVSSAYPQFAIEGFNYDVLDYLLKPISLLRLTKTIQKINDVFTLKNTPKQHLGSDGYFFVKTETKGKQIKINFEDITLIEGKLNYVAIHTGKSNILSLQNMKNIIEVLPKGKFIRVHASYIIPVKLVEKIEGNLLILKGINSPVPIGVTYKDKVIQELGVVK